MKSDQNGIELIWSRKEADDFLQAIDKCNQVDESNCCHDVLWAIENH